MPPRFLASCAAATALLLVACGPSISLDGEGTGTGTGGDQESSPDGADASSGLSPDLPAVACEPDAIVCDGSEYGTWRLTSADTTVVAYLYLWPSDSPGQREFVSRWFIEDDEVEHCTRNGRYLASGDLDSTFVFQTESQGGTNIEQCGGAPDAHSFQLELMRVPQCEGELLVLTAMDSNGAAPYTFEGHAVHCGCQTDYDPYSGNGEPLPTEGCLCP